MRLFAAGQSALGGLNIKGLVKESQVTPSESGIHLAIGDEDRKKDQLRKERLRRPEQVKRNDGLSGGFSDTAGRETEVGKLRWKKHWERERAK